MRDRPSALEEGIYNMIAGPIASVVNAILPGGEIDETLRSLQYCSRRLKEGWQLLSDYKEEMLGKDKKEAFDALNDAKERLDDAWERWKSAKQSAKEARQQQRQANREAFESRVGDRIDKLKERLDRLYSALSHREANLDKLRDMRDSARSDEHRYRVEGWIDEEEDKIAGIRSKIRDVESWLDEERSRLR